MRKCRHCDEPIWFVELKGFGSYWLDSQVNAPGAAVCFEHHLTTHGEEDEHEPMPLDVPPALDRASIEGWLS